MLTAIPTAFALPVIRKTHAGKDCSDLGAFPTRGTLCFTLRVPRALGARAVVLRLSPDGGPDTDFPLSFCGTRLGTDTYRISVLPRSLCGTANCGLFFYEFLFLREEHTLFTDATDNVTFSLCEQSRHRFSLLFYKPDFDTPHWFHGQTMYHIFVDRFARGEYTAAPTGFLHERWNEPLIQYGKQPGDPVQNNEFYGGNLAGITEKLDYLVSLGVGVLYLSPIFRAASNHKYDTGDYMEIDPGFGGESAFRNLLDACRKRGIHVILDGVFNHTGDDSRYFNRKGTYPEIGAYQSQNSPYADWYTFRRFPTEYACWWNIPILPKLRLDRLELRDFFLGQNGVVDTYTRQGISGWRLDVADELPDRFLSDLRTRVKEETDGEGLILGEVWENAAVKSSYGERRHYFLGGQLDGVMNYPLRNGILSFLRDGNAQALAAVLRELWGSYPTPVCHSLMNLLSTHDTVRILTALGGDPASESLPGDRLLNLRLSPDQRKTAVRRLFLGAVIQYTVFGVPSLFYGDEAGLEGYRDPFCRRPYPWGAEDRQILAFYRKLGRIRAKNPVFRDGDFRLIGLTAHALCYTREKDAQCIVVAVNAGQTPYTPKYPHKRAKNMMSGLTEEIGRTALGPMEFRIWRLEHVSPSVRKNYRK